MSAQAAVAALLEAVRKRDLDAVAAATKGGKIDIVPLDIKGEEFFGPLFAAFPDLEVEEVKTITSGGNALVDVVLTGTPAEPYLGIAVRDGKTLRSRQAWRIEASGETVGALRVYFCVNELKWSLGANKTYAEAIAGARV